MTWAGSLVSSQRGAVLECSQGLLDVAVFYFFATYSLVELNNAKN